jgi:hypothetical protein
MCKAFSCIVDRSAKVTWKLGVDSHTELLAKTSLKDDTADPALMTFARVEITPDNSSYLEPDTWTLRVDQSITPHWFGEKHKAAAHLAHKKWLAKLSKILVRKKIIHPFKVTPPTEITEKHINMLRKWASVGASVGAYIGSFFILPVWKYIKHSCGKYPFAPCVQLWNLGLVPSFDGKIWRIHGYSNAKVLFEISAEELRGKP